MNQPQIQEKKHPLEDIVANLAKVTQDFMSETRNRFNNQEASLKNLEMQVGQLANMMVSRQPGALPSKVEVNPKEECKMITLRSETQIDVGTGEKEQTLEQAKEEHEEGEKANQEEEKPKAPPIKPYMPPVPFPQRLQKQKMGQQFDKFVEIFRQLQITLPSADALAQVPKYVKFLRENLHKKRNLEELEFMALTEECSAVIQNKLPPKLKDPGRFSIPITIGETYFDKVLCDLGASISLMPLSICRKLGLGEIKPTSMTLQLANRSVVYPKGMIENVLIKVGKFIVPNDFVVLDMEEDKDTPLILGRPFLATVGAVIDVKSGRLTLSIGGEEVEFNLQEVAKHPSFTAYCKRVDIVDEFVQEQANEEIIKDSLEGCLVHNFKPDYVGKEIASHAHYLEALPRSKKRRHKMLKGASPPLPIPHG